MIWFREPEGRVPKLYLTDYVAIDEGRTLVKVWGYRTDEEFAIHKRLYTPIAPNCLEKW